MSPSVLMTRFTLSLGAMQLLKASDVVAKAGWLGLYMSISSLLKRRDHQLILFLKVFPSRRAPYTHELVLVDILLRSVLTGILRLLHGKEDLVAPSWFVVLRSHVEQLHAKHHRDIILHPFTLLRC